MTKKICFLVLFMLEVQICLFADRPASPAPHIVVLLGGRYYFKMFTSDIDPWDKDKGKGILYKVTNKKEDQIIWETNGWYAFQVYLTFDGTYLVRIGDLPNGHEPSDKDLAIAFYKNGQEIKKYSTKYLIKDETKVRPTTSHYEFYKGKIGFKNPYDYEFSLITIDDIEYIFDVKSGKIIKEIKKDKE